MKFNKDKNPPVANGHMCLVVLKPLLDFIDHWIHLNESESTEDSLDNVPNENVVTTGTNRQT